MLATMNRDEDRPGIAEIGRDDQVITAMEAKLGNYAVDEIGRLKEQFAMPSPVLRNALGDYAVQAS